MMPPVIERPLPSHTISAEKAADLLRESLAEIDASDAEIESSIAALQAEKRDNEIRRKTIETMFKKLGTSGHNQQSHGSKDGQKLNGTTRLTATQAIKSLLRSHPDEYTAKQVIERLENEIDSTSTDKRQMVRASIGQLKTATKDWVIENADGTLRLSNVGESRTTA